MTIPDQGSSFGAGFMDDYFAEAEEHIVAVRRSLLTLEGALGSPLPPAALEDLFRSCHSLKGISGMVELREAEVLAHQMESCLRAVKTGEVVLTPTNFEPLVDGARLLEAVIAAHRAARPLPRVERTLGQLAALAESGKPLSAGAAGVPVDNQPSTAPVWKVTFVPSADLVARGVKVDVIRMRLLQIGKLRNVTPRVLSNRGVSFEFEVETNDEQQLAAWRDDGLHYVPLEPDPAASARPRAVDPGTSTSQSVPPIERSRETLPAAGANFVRVDLARLDDLMRLVGEMVVTRARLEDTLQRVEPHVPFQEWRLLQEHSSRIERQLRDLREAVMRVRLVPVGEIFRRMPFVVRDLAHDSGKRVQLDLVGQTTEIDKFLVERMLDPVIHLVRNAISHAIETPEQRIAAGKRPEGTIRLAASTAGESVILEISDDGAGIDVTAVAERARAGGQTIPHGPLDARGLLDIICASGFSTRAEADRVSGRGVGMAVVRGTVEELGGSLAVNTTAGHGTTFTITLPLTLAITDAIIAHVGDQIYAVPQSAVREVIEVDRQALRSIERNELLTYRGGTLPIVRLARLFSIDGKERPRFHAIVVGVGLAAVGFLVDRVAGQREIVVKTISDPLLRVDGISGATELGDGRLVLILDVSALSRAVRDRSVKVEGISA